MVKYPPPSTLIKLRGIIIKNIKCIFTELQLYLSFKEKIPIIRQNNNDNTYIQ